MVYSNFTLPNVVKQFGLHLVTTERLPLKYVPVVPSLILSSNLERGADIAIQQATEKSRSEFIIAPILLEVRGIVGHEVSVFSGVELNVDSEQGLVGVCDFLFSRSTQQMFLETPILTVVEAKNEYFKQGIAQAAAEMVAAQILNQRENKPQARMFGAVTIGNEWQFLQLENSVLTVDNRFYDLNDLPEILGILVAMLSEKLLS
jgi:hypothetical protein